MIVTGGFSVPRFLIEAEATGLRLIDYVRQIWGSADRCSPLLAGQVKFADWLMSDPVELPALVEAGGIEIDALLIAGQLSDQHARYLFELTGGAIGPSDWLRLHSSAPATSPRDAEALAGAAAAEIAPPAEAAPLHPSHPPTAAPISGLSDAPGINHPPIVQGRLGECSPGRLFRCVRGMGENRFLLTGLGIAMALDRASATAAYEALGQALGRDGAR